MPGLEEVDILTIEFQIVPPILSGMSNVGAFMEFVPSFYHDPIHPQAKQAHPIAGKKFTSLAINNQWVTIRHAGVIVTGPKRSHGEGTQTSRTTPRVGIFRLQRPGHLLDQVKRHPSKIFRKPLLGHSHMGWIVVPGKRGSIGHDDRFLINHRPVLWRNHRKEVSNRFIIPGLPSWSGQIDVFPPKVLFQSRGVVKEPDPRR